MPAISATGLTVFSLILAYVAQYLKSDQLPNGSNLLIGALATLALGVLCVWMTGFTGDVQRNILFIITVWGVFFHQLLSLLQTAQASPSPLLSALQPVMDALPDVMPSPTTTAPNAIIHVANANTIHVNQPEGAKQEALLPHLETTIAPANKPEEAVTTTTPVAGTGITTPALAEETTLKTTVVKTTQLI